MLPTWISFSLPVTMDPLREQTCAFQPVDVGEAVTDFVGQLMASDDSHGTGASSKGASRNIR
jgi:hypothetical protein